MKKKATRTITMALGIVVALGVICSQLFYLPQTTPSKKEHQTEQHQSDSDDQVHFSAPSTSLPSSAHVELNPNVFFLFEILFEENTFQIPQFKISIPLGQFFRTVFGVTISPNAP
jgi:hypothetical protein